jgi:cell division protein FtsL
MAIARVVEAPNRRTGRPLPRPLGPGQDRDRHLRVVPPRRRPGLGLRLSPRTGVVLTVLLFVALFGVAVSHALLIEGQAKVDDLDQQVAAEQARYEELRRDVAELESPQRILGEATGKLGMVPTVNPVWLSPDEPAPTDDLPNDPPPESPDTSAARVKPYLEPTG